MYAISLGVPVRWTRYALWMVVVGLCSCGSSKTAEDQQNCVTLGGITPTGVSGVQVMIEVRFLTVSDNFMERVGVDFRDVGTPQADPTPSSGGVYTTLNDIGVDFQTAGGEAGSTLVVPRDHAQGSFLPQAHFGNPPQDGSTTAFAQAPGTDGICLLIDQLLAGILQPPTSLRLVPFTPAGGLAPGEGYAYELIDAAMVNSILQAIEADAAASILGSTTLRLYDQQRAFALPLQVRAPVEDLLPFVLSGINEFAREAGDVRSGVTLDIRPTVNADGNTITMEIRPGSHGAVIDYLPSVNVGNSPATIQLPILQTVEVQTTVSVPDGGTILLGGIKRLADRDRAGVPLLSKIPYINRLFRNTGTATSTSSIMMMVTPRIIIQE